MGDMIGIGKSAAFDLAMARISGGSGETLTEAMCAAVREVAEFEVYGYADAYPDEIRVETPDGGRFWVLCRSARHNEAVEYRIGGNLEDVEC